MNTEELNLFSRVDEIKSFRGQVYTEAITKNYLSYHVFHNQQDILACVTSAIFI